MIELPASCLYNKLFPKYKLQGMLALGSAAKEELASNIEKVIWKYKISEKTINTDKTENVEEIQIFQIVVRNRKVPEAIIKALSKAIAYKVIYEIVHNDHCCYVLFEKDRIWTTEWDIILPFKISGLNLTEVYSQFVKVLVAEEDTTENLDELLERRSKLAELEQELEVLKRKMNNEPQFDKKVAYNRRIVEINSEIAKLKGEMNE